MDVAPPTNLADLIAECEAKALALRELLDGIRADITTPDSGPFCEFHGRRHVCDADWSSWFRPPRIVNRRQEAPDPDPLDEYRGPDGTVLYQGEHARWVLRGDVIQAVHGDTEWEPVVSTVHADSQTGIVTMTATGTRLRWWGHFDLVRVATAPVPDPAPYRFVSDGPMPAGVTDVEPW